MNIYFCGSMTSSQEKVLFYKELISYLKEHGNVLNEFVGEKIIDFEPIYVYTRDTNNLKKSDVLIADITIASTGVGFELGYADLLDIKTLILYDENYPLPSSIIRGDSKFIIKSYKNIDEAKEKIHNFLVNE